MANGLGYLSSDDYLRERLYKAYWLLCEGKASHSIFEIGEALTYILRTNPELNAPDYVPKNIHNVKLENLPKLGLEIIEEDHDLKVIYTKSEFTCLEAATYFQFIVKLFTHESPEENNTKVGYRARMVLSNNLTYLIDLTMRCTPLQSSLHTLIVKCLLSCRQLVRPRPKQQTNESELLLSAYSEIFKVDRKTTQRILRAQHFNKYYTDQIFKYRRSENTLRKYNARFTVRANNAVLNLPPTKSRVYAAMHFGDTFSGILKLLCEIDLNHEYIVLRYQNKDVTKYSTFNEQFINSGINVLPAKIAEHTSGLDLVRHLRGQSRSLVIFSDLPSRFGETVDVEFLGKRAHFVRGPAEVSIVSRVPIVPFLTIKTPNNGYEVIVGDPIDTNVRPEETLNTAVRRVTQSLVTFLQSYIFEHPEQWHMLHVLRDFFVAKNGLDITRM